MIAEIKNSIDALEHNLRNSLTVEKIRRNRKQKRRGKKIQGSFQKTQQLIKVSERREKIRGRNDHTNRHDRKKKLNAYHWENKEIVIASYNRMLHCNEKLMNCGYVHR